MKSLLPPGPRGSFFSGCLPAFRADRVDFLARCAREHGDICSFRLAHRRVFLLNHPDLVEQVLVTDSRHFVKHFALRVNPLVLGKGLLTSAGDFWLRQRRLMNPAFQRQQVACYAPAMVALAEQMLRRWTPGQAVDIHAEMNRLTLEIAARTLFAADVGDQADAVGAALRVLLDVFMARFGRLLLPPTWVPTPQNLRLRRAVRRLDAIIYGFIAQRRQHPEQTNDLLSLLLRARDEEDHTGMTDRQLRDEAMTLFLAGHETTALVLSWTWYLLATHPEAEARVAAEAAAVLGDRSATAADWPRLPFIEQVVLEAMRLYPPAFVMGREAIQPLAIGGYHVPAGTTILLSQWLLHRDGRFWDEPARFVPERWTATAEQRRPRFAYFPFGGGPRLCIGNHFAMQEVVLLLATIARRYRFTVRDGYQAAIDPTFTLRPRGGIPAVLTRQPGAP